MLAEPVPKPTDLKPNLRYAGSVNTRYSTSPAGKKKRTSDRCKKLPKASSKGKRVRQDLVEQPAPEKENRLAEEQYSPHFGDFTRQPKLTVRSQNTPRYDFMRTSSPSATVEQSILGSREENIDDNSGRFIKEELPPDDDFWRSNSPTGAEFVTTQTYRNFTKNEPKRFKARAREAAKRKIPPGSLRGYGLSQHLGGTAVMGRSFSRTRQTDPLLPGGETLAEIDRLLDDIPDDGSTLDQERLEGIESLLEGDDELRELLSDVDWRAVSKVLVTLIALTAVMTCHVTSRVTPYVTLSRILLSRPNVTLLAKESRK